LTVSTRNLDIFGHACRGCFHRECSQNLESAFKFVARSNRLASRIPELNCANRAGGGYVLCALVVEILILASAFSLSLSLSLSARGWRAQVDLSSQASLINHRVCARLKVRTVIRCRMRKERLDMNIVCLLQSCASEIYKRDLWRAESFPQR